MPIAGLESALRKQARDASSRRDRRSDSTGRRRSGRDAADAQAVSASREICSACEDEVPAGHMMYTENGLTCAPCHAAAEAESALIRGTRQGLSATLGMGLTALLAGAAVTAMLQTRSSAALISGKGLAGWTFITSLAFALGLVAVLIGARAWLDAAKQEHTRQRVSHRLIAAFGIGSGVVSTAAAILGWALPLLA